MIYANSRIYDLVQLIRSYVVIIFFISRFCIYVNVVRGANRCNSFLLSFEIDYLTVLFMLSVFFRSSFAVHILDGLLCH